jgi:Fic family protein
MALDELSPLPPDSDDLRNQNGLRQFDAAMAIIEAAIKSPVRFNLTVGHICELNRIATEGMCEFPGKIRFRPVGISNSQHCPPAGPPDLLDRLLEDMCGYVNFHWDTANGIHLCSYVMWRLNWIHPFSDGNGRTARIVSYMVLSIHERCVLPGMPSIPEQIIANKQPYYEALAKADETFQKGALELMMMEELLHDMLSIQLANLRRRAAGEC